MRDTYMDTMRVRRTAFACLGLLLGLVLSTTDALAQQAPPALAPGNSFCTMTVQVPPGAGRGPAPPAGPGGAGRGGERGGAAVPNAAAQPAGLPKLVKVKDDVYVIQNPENTVAQIGTLGGNVTIYLTNDG